MAAHSHNLEPNHLEPRLPYRAFLVRCWQEKANGGTAWRFTLLHLGDRQGMKGFASLNALTDYLHTELAVSQAANSEGD